MGERASATASVKLDAIIDASVLRPDEASAAGLIGAELLEQLRRDAIDADCAEEVQAMRAILGRCRRQAETLARARLNARTHPVGARGVFARLNELRANLGDPIAWGIGLRRLAPLAELPEGAWRALELAPCWAVVRALGWERGSPR